MWGGDGLGTGGIRWCDVVRSIGSTGGVAMWGLQAPAGPGASPAGLERGEAEPASNTITKTVDKHGCCAFLFPCFDEFAGSKGVRQGTVSQQTWEWRTLKI